VSLTVTLEAEPRPDEVEAVGRALAAFNAEAAGDDGFERLFITVRQPCDGRLVGGLVGAVYWGWLYVDALWVEEAQRGAGLGSRLLAEAEAAAVGRGARRAFLDTFSFQAEPFYARRGYRVFGALDGFPGPHRRVWMTKPLAPAVGDEAPA
jgi:GNAT superfamily N-acetyltransferase